MNERLQEQLNTAIRTIESRKQSEKLLVMFMLLTGLVLGYLSVAYDPLNAQKVQISAQISNLQSQIQTQQASYATKEAASQEDPSRFANDRILAITAELQTLDSEIGNLAGDLVSPNEMTQILTTVLSRYSGLELIRFDNTQATPLRSGLTNSANGAVQEGDAVNNFAAAGNVEGQVYAHGLVLEFEGDFFTTLKYLRFLEEITGSFFWDTISFRVAEWPSARVTLQIHTLGTDAGFIGV